MLLLKFGLSIRLPGHALPVSTRGVWLDDDLLDDLVFRRPTPSVVFQMPLRGPDPSFIAPKKFGCALLLYDCMERLGRSHGRHASRRSCSDVRMFGPCSCSVFLSPYIMVVSVPDPWYISEWESESEKSVA